uniref:Staphylococcal nuclease domain-containing protein 1 n=1 Tax=Orthoderella ornata TaxID=444751 RepID=A0A481UJX6_9NEOP|nr:ebna2 binding protein P100 [Orthoderella ornata]
MSTPPKTNWGIVKQVLSGDTVVIRGQPKGGPPPEKTISLSNIAAPKLGRRVVNTGEETKDEPYAWEAREFLRKKLVGEEVLFTIEKAPNSSREYGCIYLGKDIATAENITETLVSEGLVSVRREARQGNEVVARLCELEDAAKAAGKGKHAASGSQEHVRDIKWSVENPRNFVEKFAGKPIKAVIEHVRDGSTVRAFLLVPPEYYHITLMISGIRCPGFRDAEGKPDPTAKVPYAEEAKFFVELRLLQRDVEIILESVNNNNFVGSVIHPKGNIAEALLKEGFAKCVDWSMTFMKSGADKLRAAERHAKENKLRLWKDYQATTPQISGKEKEYIATVVEVVNGDALMVKTADGTLKKIFLASIRPPRLQDEKANEPAQRSKNFRPLYDIPWMFEAREFLRKKLIGKKVNVVVDYIQAAKDNFPEKVCCTVTIGGVNVAEAMVSKGFATVVRYRQDDDQRSSHYDELLAAEMKASKSGAGVHAKKNLPNHRVADIAGDTAKAKQFLPFLQRAARTDAVVEFVASGSRLRLYIPKETCLVTFLLAGISCPRGARPGPGGNGSMVDGEPFGEEALAFTKDRCMQREVEIHVESMDKAGNFIGWLWVDGQNLSVLLVEAGLAKVHFTAERSEHYRALKAAEDKAKAAKLKSWKDFVEDNEEEKKIEEDKVTERKIEYQKVLVIDYTPELHFYAQLVEQGPKLEQLMNKIRQEFLANAPLAGAFTPRKGELCAAKFSEDGEWYRARVEKVSGNNVSVFYVDYGNREVVDITKCAALPSAFATEKPYAHEYGLACVQLPRDEEYRDLAVRTFAEDVQNRQLNLNIEYRVGNLPYATLIDPNHDDEDIAKTLITEGYLLVENRREKRLQRLVADYRAAQESAKKNHLNVWMYGDITEDDAKEFGLGR